MKARPGLVQPGPVESGLQPAQEGPVAVLAVPGVRWCPCVTGIRTALQVRFVMRVVHFADPGAPQRESVRRASNVRRVVFALNYAVARTGMGASMERSVIATLHAVLRLLCRARAISNAPRATIVIFASVDAVSALGNAAPAWTTRAVIRARFAYEV